MITGPQKQRNNICWIWQPDALFVCNPCSWGCRDSEPYSWRKHLSPGGRPLSLGKCFTFHIKSAWESSLCMSTWSFYTWNSDLSKQDSHYFRKQSRPLLDGFYCWAILHDSGVKFVLHHFPGPFPLEQDKNWAIQLPYNIPEGRRAHSKYPSTPIGVEDTWVFWFPCQDHANHHATFGGLLHAMYCLSL